MKPKNKSNVSKPVDAQDTDAATAQRILDADRDNLLKKVKSGKPLTASQRAVMLAQASGVKAAANGLAKNKSDLAVAVGLDRTHCNALLKRDDAPNRNSDGTYDISAMLLFMRANNIKGSAERAESEGLLPGMERESSGDNRIVTPSARKKDLECEKLAIEIEVLKGNFFDRQTVAQNYQKFITAARYVLMRMPERLKHVEGTPAEKAAAIKRAMLDVMKELNDAPWQKIFDGELKDVAKIVDEAQEDWSI